MKRLHSHPRRHLRLLGAAGLVAGIAACSDAGSSVVAPEVAIEQQGRILVTNDRGVLNRRIHYVGDVQLIIDGQFANIPLAEGVSFKRAPGDAANSVTMALLAMVDPPELDGTTLQASHIVMQGNTAYVGYNVQGPTFLGGLDVFETGGATPQLVSQALFQDTDVSAVDRKNGHVYLATATTDPQFGSPAVLEVVALDGNLLTTTSQRVDLPSFAATGVRATGGQVFVTSGDGATGGLGAFDVETLDEMWRDDFPDARAVETDGSEVIAMHGQPGGLRVYDAETGFLDRSFDPGGANIPESKSTIAIQRGIVVMAAGDEGAKLIDADDGTVLDVVPAPIVDGIDPSLTVTNAVAIHGNLVFMANGAAGLWVAGLKQNQLEVIGMIDFGDGPSVNFVAVRGNLLFAATGTGGLRIVQFSQGNNL